MDRVVHCLQVNCRRRRRSWREAAYSDACFMTFCNSVGMVSGVGDSGILVEPTILVEYELHKRLMREMEEKRRNILIIQTLQGSRG